MILLLLFLENFRPISRDIFHYEIPTLSFFICILEQIPSCTALLRHKGANELEGPSKGINKCFFL